MQKMPFERAVYKDPRYNIVIDNRGDQKEICHYKIIEEATSAHVTRFNYKGKFVGYLGFTHDFFFEDEGQLYQRILTGTIAPVSHNFALDSSGRFLVLQTGAARYALIDFESNVSDLNSITLDPREYSQVIFDGRYFVFINPETGENVYFNPSAEEEVDHIEKEEGEFGEITYRS